MTAFGSLGSSVILKGSAFLAPPHPLTFSHSLLPPLAPEPPWVSLGSWDLPGASGSLGRLCKPLAALGLQSDSGALLPLLPLTPPHSLLPSCPLSLPRVSWAPGIFLGHQEALAAFASLLQPWVFSQTQRPCFPCYPSLPSLPLTPSHLLSPPEPAWAFLGPWDLPGASGSLGSLQKPPAALGLQSDLGALLLLFLFIPLLPLIPFGSLSLLGFP